MNDFNIDEIFENINTPPPPSLQAQILSSSSKALKHSCLLRRIIKQTTSAAAILLLSIGAFLAGQSYQQKKTNNQMLADNTDKITITVDKDFLAWVDAGNFFKQIDMKDNASNAYNQAISLLPKDEINIVNRHNRSEMNSLQKTFAAIDPAIFKTIAAINSTPIDNSTKTELNERN